MRLPYTKAVIAALVAMPLASCGSQSAIKVPPSSPAARQGRLVGSAVPLALASKTRAFLVGTPPVHVTPTRLAMATRSIGWAAGKGLGGQAGSYLALGTSDGGSSFRLLFTAPAPIVAVSAPDARHAFFLEQQCTNGGYCTDFGLRLPSDPASRRTPLPSACGCHDQAPQGTCTPRSFTHAGRTT